MFMNSNLTSFFFKLIPPNACVLFKFAIIATHIYSTLKVFLLLKLLKLFTCTVLMHICVSRMCICCMRTLSVLKELQCNVPFDSY